MYMLPIATYIHVVNEVHTAYRIFLLQSYSQTPLATQNPILEGEPFYVHVNALINIQIPDYIDATIYRNCDTLGSDTVLIYAHLSHISISNIMIY